MDRPTGQPPVLEIAPGEAERAVAAIVLGFAADPMARWSLPDPGVYLTHFPAIVRAFGGRAFEHGAGHQVGGFAGATLWLPPGVEPDEEALGAIFEKSVPPERQAEVGSVMEQMAENHPAEPCWYLPFIAVDPVRQGEGLGSALLRHTLRRCDADGAPAYLEATSPASAALYERHGFEQVGLIRAGSSPPLVPMLRKPR